jgi:hypothetical protein
MKLFLDAPTAESGFPVGPPARIDNPVNSYLPRADVAASTNQNG